MLNDNRAFAHHTCFLALPLIRRYFVVVSLLVILGRLHFTLSIIRERVDCYIIRDRKTRNGLLIFLLAAYMAGIIQW